MTPTELHLAIAARLAYDHKRDKARAEEAWEQMRMGSYLNILPHLKKNSKLTPGKLLELPWDAKDKTEETDEDRRERFRAQVEKWNNE